MAGEAKVLRIVWLVSVLGMVLLALGGAVTFVQYQRTLGAACERWSVDVITSQWKQWLDHLQSGKPCWDNGWAPGVLSCIHCQCRDGKNTWDGTAAYCGVTNGG